MVNFWKRSMSMTPTFGKVAPKRSGRCVMHAPTSNPPLLPPPIASFDVDVNAIDWEPYEASLVTVPADVSVGLGRDKEIAVLRSY